MDSRKKWLEAWLLNEKGEGFLINLDALLYVKVCMEGEPITLVFSGGETLELPTTYDRIVECLDEAGGTQEHAL